MKKEETKAKGWSSLSERKKFVVVALIVALILFSSLYFYSEVKRVNSVTVIDESEYSRILMLVSGTKWKASKAGYKALREHVSPDLTGMCYVTATDESLLLEIEGKRCGYLAEFNYSNGYVVGLVDMIRSEIFFSESVLNTARALTMVLNGEKIVFYQED